MPFPLLSHRRKVRFRVDQARTGNVLEDPHWLDHKRRLEREDPSHRGSPRDSGDYNPRTADFIDTVVVKFCQQTLRISYLVLIE